MLIYIQLVNTNYCRQCGLFHRVLCASGKSPFGYRVIAHIRGTSPPCSWNYADIYDTLFYTLLSPIFSNRMRDCSRRRESAAVFYTRTVQGSFIKKATRERFRCSRAFCISSYRFFSPCLTAVRSTPSARPTAVPPSASMISRGPRPAPCRPPGRRHPAHRRR